MAEFTPFGGLHNFCEVHADLDDAVSLRMDGADPVHVVLDLFVQLGKLISVPHTLLHSTDLHCPIGSATKHDTWPAGTSTGRRHSTSAHAWVHAFLAMHHHLRLHSALPWSHVSKIHVLPASRGLVPTLAQPRELEYAQGTGEQY